MHCNALKGSFRVFFDSQKQFITSNYACLRASSGKSYTIYDFHLGDNSPCIDAGDPNYTAGENDTDIDGEDRIIDGNGDGVERIDIGADEYYWSAADFDESGIVNFFDYAVIAGAWMTDSNDANSNYVEQCDLEDNNSIDYNDLGLFCDEWLWESPVIGGWMMSMGGGGMDFGLESMLPGRVSGNKDLKAASRVSVQPELDESVVKEMLALLDKLWLGGEFDKYLSEKDYLALRAALEDFWR